MHFSSHIIINERKSWFMALVVRKRPWCWERLKAKGEESVRGWDGLIGSLIQWTWTWGNSRRQWGIWRLGVLQSMGHNVSDTTYQLKNNKRINIFLWGEEKDNNRQVFIWKVSGILVMFYLLLWCPLGLCSCCYHLENCPFIMYLPLYCVIF